MNAPDRDDVQCTNCGGRYNLGRVEVTARYADCTMFKAPCCGRQCDDREWTGSCGYRRLTGNALIGRWSW